ncbi:MAG TPA: AAA family ATPase, partial [Candidatus Eremiobacteraceae bacterium]|nr:AAA family ATPase [Candidatus Eremiobacteraceae bacterium]
MGISPPGAPLRVFLLGQPRFEVGGAPYRFTAPPKALPLLAYLVLHRLAPLPREKVAFTIWEDETEEDARANLRRHLYQLQRALPPPPRASSPWIVADGDAIQWNPQSGASSDVDDFERLAAHERDHVAAIEVYGGDLLEDSYDEWLFAERDRLRNLYHSILADLIVECRGRRDVQRAAGYAQRILNSDPWREDAVRHLMAVRYEAGDRAGAIAIYQQFDRRLREEMGVEPMPDTVAVRDLIMRNESLPSAITTRASSSPSASANDEDDEGATEISSATLLPFVGRENEMERLRMAWSRAARGRGRIVLVGGEAGIGKSRLAAEFALQAQAQGGRLLTGTTTYPEGKPFQAIADALRGAAPLLVALDIAPVWLGVAAQAVPELRARKPDLPTPPDVDPAHERLRLFEGFAVCFESLAKQRPLVVILEDLHWAGEATIAAVQFIVRRLAQLPVLIIATYREEDAPRVHPLRRMRRELQEEKTLFTIAPTPLGREHVADLLGRISATGGGIVAGESEADVLRERSAGNPLFLNELIQGMRENRGDTAGSALPETARQAIAQRVARLGDQARALAEIVAVIGQGFDVDLVGDVSGWPENDVLDGLSQLIDRRIVKESGRRSGFAYAFTHHLVQDTIYAQVAGDTRSLRHRRVARALEETYPERVGEFAAEIAHHYELGLEQEAAASAYLTAAQRAIDVYAYDEALLYLDRCIALDSAGALRREALGLRETIRSRRGLRQEQREDLDALERLAAESG